MFCPQWVTLWRGLRTIECPARGGRGSVRSHIEIRATLGSQDYTFPVRRPLIWPGSGGSYSQSFLSLTVFKSPFAFFMVSSALRDVVLYSSGNFEELRANP